MDCLVVLMIESEQPEGLSARKLVVETAKHNVLTAYTAEEGLTLLRRFPAIDAVLVHGTLLENEPDLLTKVRELAPSLPIVVASPFPDAHYPEAAFVIDSHQPQQVLELFAREFSSDSSN